MGEALNKYEHESNKTVTRQDILEYLAFSTFKQGKNKRPHFDETDKSNLTFILFNPIEGNLKEALQLTHELLKIVPFHQRALGNKKYYEDLLRQQGLIQRRGETGEYVLFIVKFFLAPLLISFTLYSDDNIVLDEPFNTANLKLTKPTDHLPEREAYEQLCR